VSDGTTVMATSIPHDIRPIFRSVVFWVCLAVYLFVERNIELDSPQDDNCDRFAEYRIFFRKYHISSCAIKSDSD